LLNTQNSNRLNYTQGWSWYAKRIDLAETKDLNKIISKYGKEKTTLIIGNFIQLLDEFHINKKHFLNDNDILKLCKEKHNDYKITVDILNSPIFFKYNDNWYNLNVLNHWKIEIPFSKYDAILNYYNEIVKSKKLKLRAIRGSKRLRCLIEKSKLNVIDFKNLIATFFIYYSQKGIEITLELIISKENLKASPGVKLELIEIFSRGKLASGNNSKIKKILELLINNEIYKYFEG